MALMTDLIGSKDNLDEEPEFLNHTQNILGVVISFMVCEIGCWIGRPKLARIVVLEGPSDWFSLQRLGVDVDLCPIPTLHTIFYHQIALVG